MKELSIIIVNYNAVSYLERCLLSIKTNLKAGTYEICVVDNASEDGSVDWIMSHYPEVKLVQNKQNLGFGAGVNQGIDSTEAPFVLWLNPDSEFLNERLGDLIDYLKTHPEVGIIGPRIEDPDGTVQLSCRSFPSYQTAFSSRYSLLTKWFPGNPLSRKYLQNDWDHSTPRETDWVSGACLLHRRVLGKLDEDFFMFCEDVDFCLRARKAGWKIVYHPLFKVLHHIGGSTRRSPRKMIREHHRSMWKYYKKHYPGFFLKDGIVYLFIQLRCWTRLLGVRKEKAV